MLYVIIAFVAIIIIFVVIRVFFKGDERLYNKALRLEKEGKYDDAFLTYENALRIDPNNLEVRWKLANLAFNKGALQRAISEYQTLIALKKFPDRRREFDIRYNLGKAYLSLSSLTNAFVEFFKILQENPMHTGANTQIAIIYAGQQRIDKAILHLRKAMM